MALYHDQVPDLNSCLALPPSLAKAAINDVKECMSILNFKKVKDSIESQYVLFLMPVGPFLNPWLPYSITFMLPKYNVHLKEV